MKRLMLVLLLIIATIINIYSLEDFEKEEIIENTLEIEWQKPEPYIEDIFNREYQPSISFLDKLNKKILHQRSVYIPLEWLAEPIIRYAGLDIYEKSRARTRSSYLTSFHIADYDSESYTRIALPEDSAFGHEIASYDQSAFVLFEYKYDKVRLWYVNSQSLETKLLLDGGITQTLSNTLKWFPDNENILISMIPEDLSKPEPKSNIPTGPIVMETSGNVSQNRTSQNLLQNAYEEDLFEYYASSQLAIINSKTGDIRKISLPGIISYADISPDGRYILIKEYKRPFSGKVSYYRFPCAWYVYDLKEDKRIYLHSQDLSAFLKAGWVQTDKRWFSWHPFYDASLMYLKTLDDGNPEITGEYKDELRIVDYPFNNDGELLLKIKNRFRNIELASKNIFIYEEYNWKLNTIKATLQNKKTTHTLWERHRRDIYDHPGEPVTYINEQGQEVIFLDDNRIYLQGQGLSADKRIPFIDILNIDTFATKNLVKFDIDDYLSISGFYNNDPNLVLLNIQNSNTPNNIYLYDIKSKNQIALTSFVDTIPELTRLQKKVIKYKRADGVDLSAILYLPENYDLDNPVRLPLLMSAYPREYADETTASQASLSDNRYVRPYGSSNFYLCLDNIAVLTNASFPIIGDAETVNNTFMEQAVANAKAAIDYLDDEGIIDPSKAVIYGHSYGAFMVANLLAHSDLFAGGIAQNGAYNRTLTPFGFQSERRTLWQAKDIYLKLSPFLYAHQIEKPLLLIHSMEDTNSGTYPMQSRRLFEALEGNGKDCRYIQLPLEEHSYNAKETHLHLLWEYKQFFDEKIR
jgi:dipeptidyl aminopeptidase/acylaminoacyl peptidase